VTGRKKISFPSPRFPEHPRQYSPARLGIFGGTFDPVHLGHLRAAEEALDILGLDEMVFMPVSIPPHKPDRNILAFEERWRMLDLAVSNNPRFRLSDLERRIPGKSYTARSLSQFRQENPGTELFFLVGCDAFLEIDTWYEYRKIFRLANIVVLCRPECSEDEVLEFVTEKVSTSYTIDSGDRRILHPELYPVHRIQNTKMDISSTRIRELAAMGLSVRYLVPDEVSSYIRENMLYEVAKGDA
jgi:nicotinate-nucleotide adenylyltransferase